MNYSPLVIAGAAVAICLGGVLQSAVGFAYAILSTPLLIRMGIPLPQTIVIVATCSCVQCSFAVSALRTEVPWRAARWAIGLRVPFVLLGIVLLKKLALRGAGDINLIVGCIICGLIAVQVAFRVPTRDRLHPAWAALAFPASGLLSGVCGMGGPPLVMWAMAHTWPSMKTRAFLFTVIMTSIPIQMVLLYWTFGTGVLESALLGLLLTPAVFVGARIGMPIGNRMSKAALRAIAYSILALIGLGAVLPRVWQSVAEYL